MEALPDNTDLIREKAPKERRLYAFGFFLILSSLLWLFVKLAGTYTIPIKLRLQLTDPPIEYYINAHQANPEINATVTSKGFGLLKFYMASFKSKPVPVPVSQLHPHRQNQNIFYITASNLRSFLAAELNLIESHLVLNDGDLVFNMEPLIERKVAVRAVYDLHFESQYKLYEQVKTEPDSVWVLAPKTVLDTLNKIDTEVIRHTKLTEDFSVQVPLVHLPILKPREEVVTAWFDVEQFTESTIEANVVKPSGVRMKLFPSRAKIVFSVAMKDFNKIGADLFFVEADTNGIGARNKFLSLRLVQHPANISVSRIEPEQVEYIILK